MTAKPCDSPAGQQDSTSDPVIQDQGPGDAQTQQLREENRALRELLAAQVQASLPREDPGWFKRLCWWLISAPGAALVEWRSLLGRDGGTPLTRRRVRCATLTVLYTLAIYGALVLLVVSCSSPNASRTGATAAGPVRVPLEPPLPLPSDRDTDAIVPASVQKAPKSDAGAGCRIGRIR